MHRDISCIDPQSLSEAILGQVAYFWHSQRKSVSHTQVSMFVLLSSSRAVYCREKVENETARLMLHSQLGPCQKMSCEKKKYYSNVYNQRLILILSDRWENSSINKLYGILWHLTQISNSVDPRLILQSSLCQARIQTLSTM